MLFFADDSSLHANHKRDTLADVQEKLQSDLDRIAEYGDNWAITFNSTKTSQLTFTNRPEKESPILKFKDDNIPNFQSLSSINI